MCLKIRYTFYIKKKSDLSNLCVFEIALKNSEPFWKTRYYNNIIIVTWLLCQTPRPCPTYAFFVHETAKPVDLLQTDNNFIFSNYDVDLFIWLNVKNTFFYDFILLWNHYFQKYKFLCNSNILIMIKNRLIEHWQSFFVNCFSEKKYQGPLFLEFDSKIKLGEQLI